jgi:TolB-like protein/DNA-binding winged helix-turn-helix (wHTH) protein/Tfp pilus assembly protein PilF
MDALAAADVFLFEGFRLDRCGGGLFRRDEAGVFVPTPIGSRALDVLGVLVSRPGNLVSRDEIINAVWPGTIVENSNLPVQVAALRRILDEGRPNGSCIQTIPGRGYRFVASVVRTNSPASPVALLSSGNGVDEHIAADEQLEGCPGTLARPDEPPSQASRRRRRPGMIAGVIGVLFLVAAGVVGWHLRSSGSDETGSAPRLSIVVLPFANLSGERDQRYFVDGVTEDLTTDLSRIPDIFVISASTARTYRNKLVEAKQIGRELGVRYVLEGSVQRSGNRLRVNAQLIDAETDAHLWAERFDRDTADLFELQREVTGRIANTLNLELVTAEAARPTHNPDALDYILRGRAVRAKPNSPEGLGQAITLFERALSFDAQSVEAQTLLANALVSRVLDQMTTSRTTDLTRAEELVDRALAASPRYALAQATKADVFRARRRCEEAIPRYETALSLNPNLAFALHALGGCKLGMGSMEEVIPIEERAIRLSPRDPNIANRYWRIGVVHLLESRAEEAIAWLEKARAANPEQAYFYVSLASAYGLNGEKKRAAAALAEARKLVRDDRFSSIACVRANGANIISSSPKIQALREATFFAGLREAGIPEK